MAISVPDHLSNTNTAFMYITGGSNHEYVVREREREREIMSMLSQILK